MDDRAGKETERDRPTPGLFAGGKQPDHPRQIGNGSHHIGGEDEGGAGGGRALGEQIPARMDERGDDDKGEGGKRHETSGGARPTRLISTSPPLGFCPSGAAADLFGRGLRNARTSNGQNRPEP